MSTTASASGSDSEDLNNNSANVENPWALEENVANGNNDIIGLIEELSSDYRLHLLHNMCNTIRETSEQELRRSCLYLVSKLAKSEHRNNSLKARLNKSERYNKLLLEYVLERDIAINEI